MLVYIYVTIVFISYNYFFGFNVTSSDDILYNMYPNARSMIPNIHSITKAFFMFYTVTPPGSIDAIPRVRNSVGKGITKADAMYMKKTPRIATLIPSILRSFVIITTRCNNMYV